jgi:putative monooxygenase
MNDETTMAPTRFRKVSADEVPVITRRGGTLRTLLGPANTGATSGFMGLATLQPGEYISEHYHPYSEEFIYLVSGHITIRLDGETFELIAHEGILVPINVKHRLENVAQVPALAVYHLSPLAPRPDMGHVDTEAHPVAAGEPR